MDRRFGGLGRLYGEEGARRIRQSHIAVVGIGGVGSWVAEALARSGVAALTLLDMDHIAESNVNRQVHALSGTLGMAKVEAMRERIHQIHPECEVHALDAFAEPSNWPAILPQGVQGVIDACDQVRTKTALADWGRRERTLFLTIGAAGGKRHAHRVEVADLSKVTHDPLLAQVRYGLRRSFGAPKEGKVLDVHCVFSREEVKAADPSCATTQSDGTLNCHGYGSVVSVTATFGMVAAGWMMDKISLQSSECVKK